MLDEVAAAIATGAAGNIIAYMLNGQVDALRAQVARIVRHGTEQERSVVLQTLEDDAVALTNKKASETDLTRRWTDILLSYLAAYPESLGDIEAFGTMAINKTMNIGSQHNHGSGPFIGGDNYGNMTFKGQK